MANTPSQPELRLVEPSFKSLFLELLANHNSLATGTGFIALSRAGPVLVTNRHNFTGRHSETNKVLSPTGAVPDEVSILHNREGALGQWVSRREPLYDAATPLWHEHPSLGTAVDISALPLTSMKDVAPRAYDLNSPGPPIAIFPSDIVSVVGFPFGLSGGGSLAIWATGFVATEQAIDYSDRPMFLIDCRSRPGQSGSPVIAHRNAGTVALEDNSNAIFAGPVTRFLGVYSGRINEQSDLGMVWKHSAVLELVSSM